MNIRDRVAGLELNQYPRVNWCIRIYHHLFSTGIEYNREWMFAWQIILSWPGPAASRCNQYRCFVYLQHCSMKFISQLIFGRWRCNSTRCREFREEMVHGQTLAHGTTSAKISKSVADGTNSKFRPCTIICWGSIYTYAITGILPAVREPLFWAGKHFS